jgi:hypothetical protein
MMKYKILIAVLLAFFLTLLTACNGTEETTISSNSIYVISLRENLELLEVEARTWQSDAYLAWADMYIRDSYPENARVINAQFYSPSKEFESLAVEMSINGTISKEKVEHSIPVDQQQLITLDDWTIDSQEALDLMLDQEGVRFIQNKGAEQCSFLILERRRADPERPVVWRLTLMECFGDFVEHTLLDPITGEILDQ